MGPDLVEMAEGAGHAETRRIMEICNACRYCEGLCDVFPAMERRRSFGLADTAYLANLCHHCGACYHACQYAPPHEFAVNVPETLAERRLETYAEFAWPAPVGRLFHRNGLAVSVAVVSVLSLVVGMMLAFINPALFWGIHLGEGAFYRIMPHSVMAGVPLAICTLVVVSLVMGWRRYWRATGASHGGVMGLGSAVWSSLTLRNLGGDNAGGGAGCPGPDDRAANARRIHHHLTFYGFMLCFAATSTATLYHYLLGREAPYGYLELPVVLGTVGGFMLCAGTAGLWYEKRRMDRAVRSFMSLGMDYAFIWLLFWVSATGLALLFLRETGFMGLLLAIHLGFVYGFFLVLPYSKFVHAVYRFAALAQSAAETRRDSGGR